MKDIALVFSLGIGTTVAFILFFILFFLVKWEGKKAALTSTLIMWLLYFPFAYLYWPGIDIFAIHFVFFTMVGYGLGIITNVRKTRIQLEEGKTVSDRWFHIGPAIIISFFLLLSIVDSNIISISDDYKPGIVAHAFREKEGQYNSYQQQLKKQEKQGWKITGGWKYPPLKDQSKPFVIHVYDKLGKAITHADVKLDLLSFADTDKDMHLTLKEDTLGTYKKNIALPIYGKWTVLVTVHKGDKLHELMGKIEVNPKIPKKGGGVK